MNFYEFLNMPKLKRVNFWAGKYSAVQAEFDTLDYLGADPTMT